MFSNQIFASGGHQSILKNVGWQYGNSFGEELINDRKIKENAKAAKMVARRPSTAGK